jgi:hypothetical protein
MKNDKEQEVVHPRVRLLALMLLEECKDDNDIQEST